MLGLTRLVIVGFFVLTLIYIVVSLWSRQVRKRKLRREWDEDIRTGNRETYIRDGLDEYSHSFRRKLILLVYVIPVVIVGLIIYLVNFY